MPLYLKAHPRRKKIVSSLNLLFNFYVSSFYTNITIQLSNIQTSEAALHRCSCIKVSWKYAANLQENIHAEATLLKSHFGKGVFLQIAAYFQNSFS